MTNLSAVIITYNEERNIKRCLDSLLPVADEIVVVDSFSTDKTKEICEAYNVVFYEHPFEDYSKQKKWANQQARFDFILTIDADEALSEELQQAIIQVKSNKKYDVYSFNRLTNYCGKWIRYCGWYPDKKERLYDKRKAEWDGRIIHEKLLINKDAEVSFLKGKLLHYSFYSVSEHIDQINKFTDLKARDLFKKGKKIFFLKMIFYSLFKFFSQYFFQLGFMDGFYGFVICVNSSYSHFIKYVKLKQLKRENEQKT